MNKNYVSSARTALYAAASAALVVVGAAGAQAGGLPEDEVSLKDTGPIYAPAPLWTGFYIGAHAGYGWSDKEWTLLENAGQGASERIGEKLASHDADGGLAGVQVGFNWQSGQWVYGVEAEWSWTDMDGRGTWERRRDGLLRDGEVDINWMATVAGRLGMTFDRTLVYAKLGAAFADEDYNHTAERDQGREPRDFNGDDTRTGFLIGAGIEHAYDANWSVKLEYNYIDFGEDDITVTEDDRRAIFDVDQDMHVVKIGLNYRFGDVREPVESFK